MCCSRDAFWEILWMGGNLLGDDDVFIEGIEMHHFGVWVSVYYKDMPIDTGFYLETRFVLLFGYLVDN